jgi:hypothetical protein
VLAFSSLPLLRDFGLIVALNVAVALLSALIVLPPLLVWTDEKGLLYRPKGGHRGTGAIASQTTPTDTAASSRTS